MQLDLFTDTPPKAAVANPIPAAKAPEAIGPLVGVVVAARDEPAQTSPLSLREVLTFYEGDGAGHPRCANLKSALRQVAKVLDRPLEDLSADPAQLRGLLQQANPARLGIKPTNWKQIKSTALGALRGCGVALLASRDSTPLLEAWQELHDALPDRSSQIGLSRLLRSLSRNQIEPAETTAADFETFKSEVENLSARSNPRAAVTQAMKLWNKAVVAVPGWPQLTAPVPRDGRHRYSLDWNEFPSSFATEVENFLAAKSNPDPLEDNYSKAVRQSTTAGRRKTIVQFASGLALSGHLQAGQISSLKVLTDIESVRSALRFLRARRPDGKFTEGDFNYLHLMKTIARHWLDDEPAAKRLSELIQQVRAQIGARPGMTARNRERLRQFVLPSNFEALFDLPGQVFKRERRDPKPSYRKSVDVMRALQVGILTFVPIRCENLTGLMLGTNIIEIGQGAKRTLRVHLPREVTKTSRVYEAPLPEHLYPLYDAWIKVHRPNVSQATSSYLFPNSRGELRNKVSVSVRLSRFIKRETGLEVHTHLFRHIAAKLYLDHDPGGIEIVRQLLGHTSTKTTLRVYAELQSDPAFKRLEDAVFGSRNGTRSAKPKARSAVGAYLS